MPGQYTLSIESAVDVAREAEKLGRDPASIAITVWFPRKDPDLMQRYQELGVERVVFNLDSEPAAKVLPEIDAIGDLMSKVNG